MLLCKYMNAVGYVRVSTDKQDNSADDQARRIRAQAALKDMTLLEVIEDIDEFSGDLNRPGAQRLLELVKARKIDAVIITKLDRLTRSVRDALDLAELFNKRGVAFISIEETIDTKSPMGEFFLTIMAAFAELERKCISSRTKVGLRNLKQQGFQTGRVRYGWTAQPRSAEEKVLKIRHKLLPNEAEQAVISRSIQLKAEGMTYMNIARILNAEGHRTRSGNEWVYQYVIRILREAKNSEVA